MALGQTLAGLAPVAGAGIGAIAGGPIGALIGQGLGQVGGNLLSDYFKQQSPSEQARNQLLQQLQGPAPFQRVNFDPIAQEEMRRFNQGVLPSIANQFGGLGALNSSGYRQSLTGAGQDIQTRLAALRAQHELGQNQFQTGSEERRRAMLAGLSGGIYGDEQAQQMNRMNQMNQIAGAVPGTFLGLSGLRSGMVNNGLANVLQQLVNQQNAQNTGINQAGQLGNQAMDRQFQNLIQQDPTKYAQIMRNVFDALNASAQVGGTFLGAAMGGV